MIEAIKSNPRTSIFGILAIASETLRANPTLISFLPDKAEGYVLGLASIVFAILTAISARDKETPAQAELKEVKKQLEKVQLKQEIKIEAQDLAWDAAARAAETVAMAAANKEEVKQEVKSEIAQEVADQPMIVKEIITDSITTTEINSPKK